MHAGIGDGGIDRAETRGGSIISGDHRRLVRHVQRYRQRLPTRRFDPAHHLRQLRLAPCAEHHLGAGPGQNLREAGAEPRRRAGHQRNPAIKPH